jgi:hypothetical protein
MNTGLMTGNLVPPTLKAGSIIPKQREWLAFIEELRNNDGKAAVTDVRGKDVGHFIINTYDLSTVELYRTNIGRFFRTLNKQLTLDL